LSVRSDAATAPRRLGGVAPNKSLQYVGVERITVLAIPRTIGTIPSSRTLVPDRRGVDAVVLFVISAAAPLNAVAGVVVPTRLALTGLTGVSHAHPAVAVVRALFSADRVAMASDVTTAAAGYVYIAPGLSRPAGDCASPVALSACFLFECAGYRGFRVIAQLACSSFRRFPDVVATGR
jgi:hypothetical protein